MPAGTRRDPCIFIAKLEGRHTKSIKNEFSGRLKLENIWRDKEISGGIPASGPWAAPLMNTEAETLHETWTF